MHALVVFFLVLAGLLGSTSCRAQTVPDAGVLQPPIERERTPPLPPQRALPAPEAAPLTLPDGATLTVREFAFSGNTLLTDAQLRTAVQPFVDRPLGFAELQRAARAVADAYRAAGYVVRSYLPQQDVTEGRVTVAVVEARFGGARVEDPQPTRVAAARLLGYVTARQRAGSPIDADAIDRGLLLADDLPGVAVVGALEPGAQDGETVLVLRAVDEPLVSGEAGGDVAGARSTGRERLTAGIRVASPLGVGDQAGVDVVKSRGTGYARLNWTLPVGSDGWRVGANASTFDYRLVGSDFAALDAKGGSTGGGIDLNVPLLRSRQANVYVQTTLDWKRYRNQAHGADQSRYRIGSAGLGLAGNAFDDIAGGGATNWAATLVGGSVRLGAPDPGENPAIGGGYGKLRWAVSRTQGLLPSLGAYAAASGQFANGTLDSSERLYLGGPTGVRAYPVNEGSGSRGALVNLELRWRPLPEAQASVFFDIGRVKNDSVGRDLTYKGAGVALAFAAPYGIDIKATLARRIGDNPYPTAAGRDQDGSLRRLRPWLQASVAF